MHGDKYSILLIGFRQYIDLFFKNRRLEIYFFQIFYKFDEISKFNKVFDEGLKLIVLEDVP